MASIPERILGLLATRPGLTDREITDVLKGRDVGQQHVNQQARSLEARGKLVRRARPDGKIGNYLASDAPGPSSPREPAPRGSELPDGLQEDEVKHAVLAWLQSQGWSAQVAMGRTPGPDIDALKVDDRWIIEAKGIGSLSAMRVNYFLAALGELLQRMNDPRARYSIAFPDVAQFRGLWERLPMLAKRRTGVSALFVDAKGRVDHVVPEG